MPVQLELMEKEKHMKNLKRKLESWRELVLAANSVLLWEQPWYPGLIIGLTTTLFFIYWMMEPAFLTWISSLLFTAAMLDYFAPILATNFLSNNWTGPKEKKFEEICQTLSSMILRIQSIWTFMLTSRSNRPLIYYSTLYVCLFLLAWLGHVIDNLLLLYLLVNIILLTPGLKHKHRVQYAIKSVYNYAVHRKLE